MILDQNLMDGKYWMQHHKQEVVVINSTILHLLIFKGLFRLGPASKYAIRNAIIKPDFDAGFVLSEVNANKIFYKQQRDGSFKQYMVKTDEVGILIYLLKIKTFLRKTDQYKNGRM